MIEKLVSRYVRHMNQRLMNFEASPDGVAIPPPGAEKKYLLYLHIRLCVVL